MGKKFLWILTLVVLATAVGGLAAVVQGNQLALELRLSGGQEVRVEYGETYQEPGAEAILRGRYLFPQGLSLKAAKVSASGRVETTQLGTYPIQYTAKFLWWETSEQRVVHVVDTLPPEITLGADGPTAQDRHDGDLTDQIQIREEPGLIFYEATDSSGNTASLSQEVPLEDRPPEIHLEGGAYYTHPAGVPFQEPGYWAEDERQDLTRQVEISGEVCWYLCGTYPLSYTVTDGQGNTVTTERMVEVVPQPRPEVERPPRGTLYLTFDDGPGPHTRELLDVLDEYGVKATFFVTDSGYDETMGEIVSRGHSIGIHTVSHNYEEIYSSPQAYFSDLYQMQAIIRENTGITTTLMRFPGGSSNTVSRHACEGIMTTLTQAVEDAGFQYFDWNIDSDDAGRARKPETVVQNVKDGILAQGGGVILQHDIHDYSVKAVEEIIVWALNNGYRFQPLTASSPGCHHGVNN